MLAPSGESARYLAPRPPTKRLTSTPAARSTTDTSLLTRLATYRNRPGRSVRTEFGSNPAGRLRTTWSAAVSISETESLHEFATYRRVPSGDSVKPLGTRPTLIRRTILAARASYATTSSVPSHSAKEHTSE